LVRRSAKHHAEVTVDHAKRVFSRALKKLATSQGHNPTREFSPRKIIEKETAPLTELARVERQCGGGAEQ